MSVYLASHGWLSGSWNLIRSHFSCSYSSQFWCSVFSSSHFPNLYQISFSGFFCSLFIFCISCFHPFGSATHPVLYNVSSSLQSKGMLHFRFCPFQLQSSILLVLLSILFNDTDYLTLLRCFVRRNCRGSLSPTFTGKGYFFVHFPFSQWVRGTIPVALLL